MATTVFEEIRSRGEELIDELQYIIREGNARKLIVRDRRGQTLFEAPLTLASAGVGGLFMLHPILSSIGAFLMFSQDLSIIVEKYPEEEKKGASQASSNRKKSFPKAGKDKNEIEADYVPIQDEDEDEDEEKNKKG
jgi:hypothetical protein